MGRFDSPRRDGNILEIGFKSDNLPIPINGIGVPIPRSPTHKIKFLSFR